MNLGWESGKDKQTLYSLFAIKTSHMSVLLENRKITRKKTSKLFSCDYDHQDMVKCRQNVNFEETDTEPSSEKNSRFWLVGGIFK